MVKRPSPSWTRYGKAFLVFGTINEVIVPRQLRSRSLLQNAPALPLPVTVEPTTLFLTARWQSSPAGRARAVREVLLVFWNYKYCILFPSPCPHPTPPHYYPTFGYHLLLVSFIIINTTS